MMFHTWLNMTCCAQVQRLCGAATRLCLSLPRQPATTHQQKQSKSFHFSSPFLPSTSFPPLFCLCFSSANWRKEKILSSRSGGGGGGPPAAHIKEARGYGDSCPQFLWFKCLLFDSSFSCKKMNILLLSLLILHQVRCIPA